MGKDSKAPGEDSISAFSLPSPVSVARSLLPGLAASALLLATRSRVAEREGL